MLLIINDSFTSLFLGEILQIPFFHVAAFTDNVFGGNPAAVCILQNWLPDNLMQKIATENAVAETAFVIAQDRNYKIRWFTPEIEMDLCGHATLAAAHVLARHLAPSQSELKFSSNSGVLTVTVHENLISLNFPSRKPEPSNLPKEISDAFSIQPIAVLKSRDYVLVFDDENTIRNTTPNQSVLDQINLDPGGVVITSRGTSVDFVSRFFTPQASIFEDPVTGSAHCSLVPYWSGQLGKKTMNALQLSPRVGKLICENLGERVLISGEAVTYKNGHITV